MIEDFDGLRDLGQQLHPAVAKDMLGWRDHPELGRLLASLRAHVSRKVFLDKLAEGVVARRLLARGAQLRFEVATPSGKQCDFEARLDGRTLYLHVKRLDTDRPPHNPRRVLEASSRLRILERIPRPYVVKVRWIEGLRDEQMQELVTQAADFITRARIGDEMRARDYDGREIGGVRIIAPASGRNVEVAISLPSRFLDQAPRFRKLLHRAYQQFMPGSGAANVILVCSGHDEDAQDFDTALLGSHVERWDAYPQRGERVAHGRASDGFWHGHRFIESQFAGWFSLSPQQEQIQPRLWVRENVPADLELKELLFRLFEPGNR